MRRAIRYKDAFMVGKLSSPKLPAPEDSFTADKQVSAQIPVADIEEPTFSIKKEYRGPGVKREHRGPGTFWGSRAGAGSE